jgi:hypothetical protein
LQYLDFWHNAIQRVIISLVGEEDPLWIMSVVIHQLGGRDHCVLGPEKPAALEVTSVVGSLENFSDPSNIIRLFFPAYTGIMTKLESE